jgi:hypothetical protein
MCNSGEIMNGNDYEEPAGPYKTATSLIVAAHHHGYLPENAKAKYLYGSDLARLDMLGHAIGMLQQDRGMYVVPKGAGWEFAKAYGPLIRLAIFELTYSGRQNRSWTHFAILFQHYFGDQIDPLLPSIYLAAVAHPAVSVSEEMAQDVAQIALNLAHTD